MGKFKTYNIDLKNLEVGNHEFQYSLNNQFFIDIDGDEVQKGKIEVLLNIKRTTTMFEMNFHFDGKVTVSCDRCLDDMDIPITTNNRLIVKFGHEYSEESDEIVIIPEEEGDINIAWFMYEFICLAIPMKHVHAPGKCNKGMAAKLRQHTAKSQNDEDSFDEGDEDFINNDAIETEVKTDPRWDALKNLLENDNN